MKLIVGLGNIGNQYKNTRHNLGFLVIDELEKRWKLEWKHETSASISIFHFKDEKIIVAKPNLFMNNSGQVVKGILNYFKVDIKDLLIFVDDKDMDMSNVKVVQEGGHGGQNGIKNIIENLGTKKFLRVKGGIGFDNKYKTSDYVLGKWNKEQESKLPKFIDNLANIAQEFIEGKNFIELANKYNEKK